MKLPRRFSRVVAVCRGRFVEDVFCIGLFSLCAFLMVYPISGLPGYLNSMGGDVFHNIWIWSRNIANVLHGMSPTSPNILYPEANSSYFSEMEFGNTLVFAALHWLLASDVAAYAGVFLLSMVLTGYMTYKIAYLLGSRFDCAILAGTIAGFCNYHFTHPFHVQLLTLYWALIPIYFVLDHLFRGRSSALWFLFLTLVPLCAGPSYTVVAFVFLYIAVLASQCASAVADAVVAGRLRRVLLVSLAALVAMSPILLQYLQLATSGLARGLPDHEPLKLDLSFLFLAPERNWLYGGLSKKFFTHPVAPIGAMFPGFAASFVLLYSVASIRGAAVMQLDARVRHLIICVTVAAVILFLCSLGSAVTWNSVRLMPNPVYQVASYLGVFSATRFLLHFAYPAMCFACIVAAVVLSKKLDAARGSVRFVLLSCLVLLVVAENRPDWPTRDFVGIDEAGKVSPMYGFLKTLPPGKSLLLLPLGNEVGAAGNTRHQFVYMRHAWRHRLWMVNGATGFIPPHILSARSAFSAFPSADGMTWLAKFKVDYLVVDRTAPEEHGFRDKQSGLECPALIRLHATPEFVAFRIDHGRWKDCGLPDEQQPTSRSVREQLADGIDFSKAGYPDFIAGVDGMSDAETWGRWSDANLSRVVRFRFRQPLPKSFRLILEGGAYASNLGQAVRIRVGGQERDISFSSTPFVRPNSVDIPFDLPRESSMIEMIVPSPEIPPGDSRKVGVGLIRLRIVQ